MSPAKRFLMICAAVSLIVWIAGVSLWGPPDYSAAYMETYKHEHDHYLEITKSDAYKRYAQRPHLNGPDSPNAPEHFADMLAFVEHYEARPEFQAEQQRRHIFERFFRIFNSSLLVVIAVYLGRKPFLNFLDGKIAETNDGLESAAQARAGAEAMLAKVEESLKDFSSLKEKIAQDTQSRIEHETAILSAKHKSNKAQVERELQDRKALAVHRAGLRVRRELSDLALKQLEDKAKTADGQRHAAWIEDFCLDLERRA